MFCSAYKPALSCFCYKNNILNFISCSWSSSWSSINVIWRDWWNKEEKGTLGSRKTGRNYTSCSIVKRAMSKMRNSCDELFGSIEETWQMVLYVIIFAVLITLSTIFNSAVLVLIIKKPVLHRPSFVLIAALACSDLMMALGPGTIYLVITLLGKSKNCTVEIVTCCITSAIASTTVLLLCCITHDRYVCIRDCRKQTPHTTRRKVYAKIAVCCLVSSLVSSLFYIETIVHLPLRAVEILSCLMFGSFVHIIVHYMKLSRNLSLQQGRAGYKMNSHRTNVNYSIVMLVSTFLVAYSPITIIFLVHIFTYRMHLETNKKAVFAFLWCSLLGYFNSVIDPVIYAYRSDAIGREIRRVFFTPSLSLFIHFTGWGLDP